MNQTHLHLVITHLPIFGSMLGGFVLAYGLWAKSDQTKIAAYYILIFSALGAGIAYLTGEAAEETIENIQGIAENTVDAHEDFAVFALISLLTLGLGAIAGLILILKKSSIAAKVAVVILLLSLLSFILVARTGYLGGQIRHSELNDPGASAGQTAPETDD